MPRHQQRSLTCLSCLQIQTERIPANGKTFCQLREQIYSPLNRPAGNDVLVECDLGHVGEGRCRHGTPFTMIPSNPLINTPIGRTIHSACLDSNCSQFERLSLSELHNGHRYVCNIIKAKPWMSNWHDPRLRRPDCQIFRRHQHLHP